MIYLLLRKVLEEKEWKEMISSLLLKNSMTKISRPSRVN